MTITFGSVCSGIEAASVAWHPLGWKTAYVATEAKKPPSADYLSNLPSHLRDAVSAENLQSAPFTGSADNWRAFVEGRLSDGIFDSAEAGE